MCKIFAASGGKKEQHAQMKQMKGRILYSTQQ